MEAVAVEAQTEALPVPQQIELQNVEAPTEVTPVEAQPAENAESATVIELDTQSKPKGQAKAAAPQFDSLDALLRAMNEQDEQLKAVKATVQELLTTNAALKRGVKQIVQDAQKNDEVENELTQARKKLAMLKTFING